MFKSIRNIHLVAVSLAFLSLSSMAMASFLPVCERTEAVKQNLVTQTGKACEQITEADLLSIKRVAVNGKNISAFQKDDFTGLRNMEILNIRNNPFAALPEGMFNDLVSLNTLVIISTKLKEFPEDFLEATPLMKELITFRNELTTISEPVLHRLEQLKELKQFEMDRKVNAEVAQRLKTLFPPGGKVFFLLK